MILEKEVEDIKSTDEEVWNEYVSRHSEAVPVMAKVMAVKTQGTWVWVPRTHLKILVWWFAGLVVGIHTEIGVSPDLTSQPTCLANQWTSHFLYGDAASKHGDHNCIVGLCCWRHHPFWLQDIEKSMSNQLENPSLAASFYSTGICCAVQGGGWKDINGLSQCWPLCATTPTCQARCAHWHNSGITILQ